MNIVEEIVRMIVQGILLDLKPFIKEALEGHLLSEMEKPPEDDLLTSVEAAKLLNCSRTTLWSYCKSGKLESYRIGQKIFFKKSDLIKGLKKRSLKSR